MLFSRPDVANVLNNAFEPVWQSVRPVPVVRIDFGNGTVVTRTLHGNIASYVCTADGRVLDVLPGIYTPAAYLGCLNQFRLLAYYVAQNGPEASLKDYHRVQAEALAKNLPPSRLMVDMRRMPMTKAAIERSAVKILLVTGKELPPAKPEAAPAFDSPEDLANWKLLADDTRLNETAHRLLIHEKLAQAGPVPPEQITRWLYKEVLHADLDDPYLGLGSVLFAHYPFKEDAR